VPGRAAIIVVPSGFEELEISWHVIPYSGKSRIGARPKLSQPSQPEGKKKANSPQFIYIGGGDWASSRKSTLMSIRVLPDYTVGNQYLSTRKCLREIEAMWTGLQKPMGSRL